MFGPFFCYSANYQPSAIQGKDCLVQKFRNSSVMLEAAHYRPKVCGSYFAFSRQLWHH